MTDTINFLRSWAKDIREQDGHSADADQLDDAAAAIEARDAKITDLEARLRISEKAREACEARNDFLISELDKFIEKVKA